jgi:ribonuclease P protein component
MRDTELSASFPQSFRIKKKKVFNRLYEDGRKISGFYYAVYFFYTEKQSSLGITVSSRFGNAVFRNRQKRIIRELFRKVCRSFQTPLLVVVVLTKKPVQDKSVKELSRIFQWLSGLRISSAN